MMVSIRIRRKRRLAVAASAAAVLLGLWVCLGADPALAQSDPFKAGTDMLVKPADSVLNLVRVLGVFGIIAGAIGLIFMRGKVNWLWYACIIAGLIVAGRADLFVKYFMGTGNPIANVLG